MSGKLYVISAPSGAGKTTLIHAVVEQLKEVKISVSHTTRPMRAGEQEGVHYHFVSDGVFNAMKHSGFFLEHASVFRYQYGTSREWVAARLAEGMDVILELDWQGGLQIQRQLPEAILIFILPPSKVALQHRLEARAQDSKETIAVRLAGAVEEMRHFHEYDYVLINDDFMKTLADLMAIFRAEPLRVASQAKKQERLIDDLLN